MKEIAPEIRDFIAENILFSGDSFPYTDETSFLDQGIVDSMNVLEIVRKCPGNVLKCPEIFPELSWNFPRKFR